MNSNETRLQSPQQLPAHLLRARLRGLYVITEDDAERHETIARAAIAGGASIVQLRDKSTPLARLYAIALHLRRLTREANVLFLINDRPDLALACEADGAHLGPDDLPPAAARRVLGPHAIIGVSCGTVEEVRSAEEHGADYIGAGAVFSTSTKTDAGTPIGLETLREIIAATTLPVAGIGGITETNIAGVMQCGAAMACVVSAISRAGDENEMTEATRKLAEHARQPSTLSKLNKIAK